MVSLTNPRLPKGSTVLVTGVTGYIGAWVAHEALTAGYKVRGAVRSLEKAAWLQSQFDSVFGPGQYSQVVLANVTDKASLEAAIKDVAGVAHIAVNTELTNNPEPYVSQTVEETLAVLRAAKAEPSVKSVVLTSSSMAAVPWGAKGKISKDAYNDEYVKLAYDNSVPDPHGVKKWFVYAAAKAQAEKAAWKYVQEEKPDYALNTVLPSFNFGPSLVFENQGYASTGAFPKVVFDGNMEEAAKMPSQYFIDVRDTAKLHIAALVHPGIANERLWGFAEAENVNAILAVFRKLWPERKFVDDLEDSSLDTSIPPTESALKALKDVYGQSGWTSLETSLEDAGYDR